MNDKDWISVEDALPEINKWVLFVCTNELMYVGRWRGPRLGWKSPFQGHVMCPPTHWQPLPEPPEKKD